MTKANECTCPSGDGSLRHPCPAHPASVELAGVGAKLTFINGRPAMCGCQVEYSSGGGEYSDVIDVTLCAKHSGSAILDLVATNRIALTPEYEGQWHADFYLDREIPLAKAEGATPAEAVLALMSAERIDPEQESVEQAGGDERVIGWRERILAAHPNSDPGFWPDALLVEHMAAEIADLRAALAQPSPVRSSLLINGYQLRAALDFIAPDGTAEQLESEACIEWRQQDADFLEAGLYAFCAEYPEEGGVLLDEEPTTAQPSPLQSEQAEAERPEVVAYADPVAFATFKERGHEGGVAGREWMWAEPGAALVAMSRTDECERIVGALRAKADQLREALEWRKENQAGQRELLRSVTAERDAALARVVELERQEPVATVAKVPGEDWNSLDFHRDLQDMQPGTKLYAAPVAQAQHSVQEGWMLVPVEPLLNMMSDKDHDTRITAERQLLSILATAPGKEVPQAWIDVQAERRRQITAEGWTPEHDDLYCAAELPRAAAAYILNGANDEAPAIWPFVAKWWKPRDARSNYVRASALILAEIERLDRAAPGKEGA
ncbi:hypothetical protein [Pseudomonas aeruginosa]|uniref:hypothetical protein n=1 Tax=Pseudomonas aeruginosa TaxID=287 RepID=UPI0021E399EF|nr:hypothetical protein [Pseudomonas aeruginosa]MCV2466851.1 hypothetical protein [Pseudomonas aeruginosa]MCV2472861.1 hypothetical protein [Pseudomonas aeruginosa]MCV2478867.1 hypothetical protein [Pseudomonas aeruginosa]WPE94110.1 hypothetical protein PQC53_07075 [Pseudomonas aeruginosa]